MPLVRVQVRNEYGLGQPELYRDANREDPKAILDGVAVAGLVGILRQLGDLAEFAAEVFHGLQEQVMTTASRSHKLMVRVQHIEAALPPLERAVLAQTSHIHFAYTAGSEWHPRIKNEQNHFICNDLPRFIMDSYEECRDPPRLQLLDKFDTGGPGSCLKRYSDPTYFRRVSGSGVEANAEKAQRDKKARKSKKKRTSQRNGEMSRGASISIQSGRFQFTSPIVNGQASPSQTASTFDMTLKSDLEDHSNSFDSRTGSGCIECVVNISSSMQPEEQDSKDSSSSLMQHIGTLDSVSPDEQTRVVVVDDTFSHSSPQEQTAPNSSCVTWDEKTEIVEPKDQHCGRDQALEMLPTNFNPEPQDSGTVNLEIVDQKDISIGDEDSPKSISSMSQLEEIDSMSQLEEIDSMSQLEEIESEPDNFMDALNTIESESETDLDCQTKREVEQYSSNVKTDRIEDGLQELMAHSSVHHPPNVESQNASSIPSDNRMSWTLPDSAPSESFTHEQTPQISAKSSDSDHSPGANFCASAYILDGSRVESVISEPSSSGSRISNLQDPSGDRTISSICESQESHADFSGVHSIKFWTNGGLLGLEPSKPPDFAVSNAGSQDFVTRSRDETISSSNHASILKGDMQKGKLGALVENAENTEEVSFSSTDVDAKPEKSVDSHHIKRFDHSYAGGLNVTGVVAPTTKLPVDPDVKATSIEANQENDVNSSGVFGLGHRLLVNGFRRKVSVVNDGKSESPSSVKAGVLDQRSGNHSFAYQAVPETMFKEQFGRASPVDSLTSSPPLEHMKISFNPIDGFETSKLKLKFPDGSHCHASVRDMFPSFQLVPEPAIPLHDIGSDSDDGTFYRSSPNMSDDCVSHQSESDSEQWESGETPGNNDPDLYDALCRMSSMQSLSSSVQLGGTANNGIHVNGELKSTYTENGAEPSLSGPLLDLPSFDAVNVTLQGERENNSDSSNLLNSQNSREPTPIPPPLPPVQWRVPKSQSDLAEDEQYAVSEALKHAFDLKLLGSSISQQPKPAPAKQQHTNEDDVEFKPECKQSDQQKLNGQKESNLAANDKGMDEKEDFLQQIRTKSFNLRRTVTTRPTVTQTPTPNVSVTAILEKANAIRQAVGSDDGEDDDNWSDT